MTYLRPAGARTASAVCSLLAPCAAILAMRAIGLYYRHYTGRLPFEAE